jgi:hypothetical protein
VAVAAALALVAALALRDADFSRLGKGAGQVLDALNPCRMDASAQAFRASLGAELEAARLSEREAASARVGTVVDGLYAEVEKGADAYLDWYFTVLGEYERLVALVAGNLSEKMRGELEGRLFGEGFSRRLDAASNALAEESAERLRAVGDNVGARLRSEAAARPCLAEVVSLPRLPGVERDVLRASTAAATGAAVGTAVAIVLARRAAAAAAARAASAQGFRSAAALAGRTATKRGGAALGAGAIAAAACGPAVALCATIAAVVTWIALDKTFVEIDELVSRQDMRREILEAAREQKAALAAALIERQHAAIDGAIAEIDASVGRVFVPARQGL